MKKLKREAGITLIETMLTLAIFTVGGLGVVSMMGYSMRLDATNKESATATLAARRMLERMQATSFKEIYATYGDPSKTFEETEVESIAKLDSSVESLQTIEAIKSTVLTEIGLTTIALADNEIGSAFKVDNLKAVEGTSAVGQIVFPAAEGVLAENVTMPELGLPRDLNGDGTIDSDSRAGDYMILPVKIRMSWKGIDGPRTLEFHAVLRP